MSFKERKSKYDKLRKKYHGNKIADMLQDAVDATTKGVYNFYWMELKPLNLRGTTIMGCVGLLEEIFNQQITEDDIRIMIENAEDSKTKKNLNLTLQKLKQEDQLSRFKTGKFANILEQSELFAKFLYANWLQDNKAAHKFFYNYKKRILDSEDKAFLDPYNFSVKAEAFMKMILKEAEASMTEAMEEHSKPYLEKWIMGPLAKKYQVFSPKEKKNKNKSTKQSKKELTNGEDSTTPTNETSLEIQDTPPLSIVEDSPKEE